MYRLLLSLLRRWPWGALRQHCDLFPTGLALLPNVLSALYTFLRVASRVCSHQRATAYVEMNTRCLSGA